MFSAKLAVFMALAFTAVTQAQDSTSTAPGSDATAGLSPCILQCATSSSTCSLTDVQCVCTNTDYQNAVSQCIQSNCPDQAEAAVGVQQAQCAAVSGASSAISATSALASSASAVSSSLSSKASSITSKASSALSSASAAASSAVSPSGNAASAIQVISPGVGAALGVVILGAAAGGMML